MKFDSWNVCQETITNNNVCAALSRNIHMKFWRKQNLLCRKCFFFFTNEVWTLKFRMHRKYSRAWVRTSRFVDGIIFAPAMTRFQLLFVLQSALCSAIELQCAIWSLQRSRSLCTIHPFRVHSFAYTRLLSSIVGSKAKLRWLFFVCNARARVTDAVLILSDGKRVWKNCIGWFG